MRDLKVTYATSIQTKQAIPNGPSHRICINFNNNIPITESICHTFLRTYGWDELCGHHTTQMY